MAIRFSQRLILLAITAVVILVVQDKTLLADQTAYYASYDPATYGLPDSVAGYKTIAVLTAENTACLPPHTQELVVQSPTIFDNVFKDGSPTTVSEAMEKLETDPQIHWEVEFAGNTITRETFITENEKINAFSRTADNNCLREATGFAPEQLEQIVQNQH